MSRKSKKAEQRALRDRILKEQAEKRRNPNLPAQERAEFDRILTAMQRELDRASRPASVACPLLDPIGLRRSHIGGSAFVPRKRRLLRSHQPDWPHGRNGPLSLALELFPDELPIRPAALDGIVLFQLFLEIKFDDSAAHKNEAGRYEDGDWSIRTYNSLDGLVPFTASPSIPEMLLDWKVEKTVPGYPDDLEAIDQAIDNAFQTLPECHKLYADMVDQTFGGWPTWLQGGDTPNYVMQIAGDFIGVDCGFDGIFFVGCKSGQWTLHWEIG